MKNAVRAVYTLEFKQEAVRLVHGGEQVSSVARTPGGPNTGGPNTGGIDKID